MAKTVLQIIRTMAGRTNIPVPNSAVGSSNTQVTQLVGLLEEVGQFITQEFSEFEQLSRSSTWKSVAGEDQGALTTLLGAEGQYLNFFITETFWDRSLRRPILGGISDAALQALKAFQPTGPYSQYKIANGHLHFIPAIDAGHDIAVSWRTKAWITTFPGGPGQPSVLGDTFVNDADVPLFDDYLLTKGLRAFWKREKGLAYADDFADFMTLCASKCGRSKAKTPLYLDAPQNSIIPGIFVPAGSWPVGGS